MPPGAGRRGKVAPFPIMKNQTTGPTRQTRPPQPRATAPHQPLDPIEQEARHRRLYTDFLALALYPGMRQTGTAQARPSAA